MRNWSEEDIEEAYYEWLEEHCECIDKEECTCEDFHEWYNSYLFDIAECYADEYREHLG